MSDADYSKLTDQEFDQKLTEVVGDTPAGVLLQLPGVYEAAREYFNDQVLRWWEEENPLLAHPPIIYDSWDEHDPDGFVDRYTVIPRHGEFAGNGDEGPTAYLGCSKGGRAFSQWGELKESYTHENYAHLGRRVTLDELDPDTQAHIKRRLTEEL